jgi:hypothetical protein
LIERRQDAGGFVPHGNSGNTVGPLLGGRNTFEQRANGLKLSFHSYPCHGYHKVSAGRVIISQMALPQPHFGRDARLRKASQALFPQQCKASLQNLFPAVLHLDLNFGRYTK